jgi:predicted porin
MKRLGIAAAATIALGGLAHAADLPTTKPAAAPPPANCFSSLWAYLNSSAAECPLSYAGFTFYLTYDIGLGYESNGSAFNGAYPQGVANTIQKTSNGPRWLWTPNGINQTVAGIAMKEPIPWVPGWSIVGTLEYGFDPFTGQPANGQRSLVQENGKALVLQTVNSDSSRAGQFDNSQGFIGISSPTYGTLTAGRVNSLTLDGSIAYDIMGSAYAFSLFGASGSFAGLGDTETNRANTGVKYRVAYQNFHAAGLWQWGGYDQGNGTTGMYQGDVGVDLTDPWLGGTLSLDGLGSYAQNAVNLSNFTGTCTHITKGPFKGQTGCSDGIPTGYGPDDLKATLSNNTGTMLLAKYKWGPATISGGWLWWQQANPGSDFPNGFQTTGGYSVPATIVTTNKTIAKLFPTTWVSSTTYNDMRVVNVPFIGAKYAINSQLDVSGAFYYEVQNNYNSSTTPCKVTPTTFTYPNGTTATVLRTNSGSCAGTETVWSFLLDYRPVKRVDLYAGVMISNVYAGLANGFQQTQDIAPTVGMRVKF